MERTVFEVSLGLRSGAEAAIRSHGVIVALIVAALFAGQASVQAQPLTTVRVASGLSLPLFCTAPAGDYSRLYIAEQTGAIRVLDLTTGSLLPGAFIDLSSVAVLGGERGLLGMAFHPDFASNGYYYVHYSTNAGGMMSNVVRYTADVANPSTTIPGSALPIWSALQPASTHNGGMLAFNPIEQSANLYIALGDGGGGGGGDPHNNSQNLNSPLAKILRIDVDGPAPYSVPADNPGPAGLLSTTVPETWVYGLRNPWRFSFDALTGDMYVGDVGQGSWEEINFISAASVGGVNFGWRCREGAHCHGTFAGSCTCSTSSLVDPIWEYSHSSGCAVVGGEVYRGSAIPSLYGHYLYADYCSGRIWSLLFDGTSVSQFAERTTEFAPSGPHTIDSISSFGRDAAGEIYICDLLGGEVFKIVPAGMADCNNNNVLDSLEIGVGAVEDCDLNGVPDSCDLASGAVDADTNGILDICEGGVEFVRADCNLDSNVDIADPIAALHQLFVASGTLCSDACDANDDGAFDIADPIFVLARLFSVGPSPSPPYPDCGLDPTLDALACSAAPACP